MDRHVFGDRSLADARSREKRKNRAQRIFFSILPSILRHPGANFGIGVRSGVCTRVCVCVYISGEGGVEETDKRENALKSISRVTITW